MRDHFRYFEDYKVGQKSITASGLDSRTVTEADIVNFACLTAIYHRNHLDRYYMANSIYGERVAQGLLGSSLVTGMIALNAPHILGYSGPAYFYGFEADYRGAIKLGDTIRIQWCVAEVVDDPVHEGFGIVKTAFQVINQEGASIYSGTITILVRKESAKDAVLHLKPADPWQITEPILYDPEKVYYAEDYPVDKGEETFGRTITETDIVNFSGLTGDYNPQSVDAEFARESMFGERIASGMLVYIITSGLWVRARNKHQEPESSIAGHLNDKATFFVPVKIGDTIRCRYKIIANRVSKSKPEACLVTFGLQTVNQRNEVVQEGSTVLMLPSRLV